jgi:hypothetical protein
MDNAVVRYVPVGTVLKLDDVPLHFSSRIRAFLDREVPNR